MHDDHEPGRKKAENEALFRHQVVVAVLAIEARGELRAEAMREVAEALWVGPHGQARRVSVRSLYRWLKQYREHGLEGLAPKRRKRSHWVLDETLLAYLEAQKDADPRASIPELMKRAQAHGLIDAATAPDRSTVYRALRRRGVRTTRAKTGKRAPARRFSYHHRMEMVLCDGKHFRAGVHRARRVALFFIDDATRMVLSVVVGPSERAALYLRGLYRCVYRFGLMQRLFCDNGSAFIAGDSGRVTAQLGIHLIHGTVGYPEGRGKAERFNRTVGEALLRHLDGNPEVSADCRALEVRLEHYVQHVYNKQPHSAHEGKAPAVRFADDPSPLRLYPGPEPLEDAFVLAETRSVSRDHVIQLAGTRYEAPGGTAGQAITLERNVLTGAVTMLHQGRCIRLAEIDLAANAHRPNTGAASPETANQPCPDGPSHAQSSFEADYAPLVDGTGNYPDEEDPSDE